jgi:hypothetical protein
MSLPNLLQHLANFGAAGLMGSMWLGERMLNRRREQQLDHAHQRIARDEERLATLMDIIGRNSASIVRLAQEQKDQTDMLKHLLEDLHHDCLPHPPYPKRA